LALRRHTLPRFWLGLTLGGVALLCGVAYWWEQQLPQRLRDAAQRGDLEACLRYGQQLAALSWLGQRAPAEQASCRRRQAELAWEQGERSQALRLQEQLVNSGIGSSSEQQQDRQRLMRWRDQLRNQALLSFREGNIEGAIALLEPVEQGDGRPGTRLSDSLLETWNRNRMNHELLLELVKKRKWWEALSRLNQLDHPWWQDKALPQRQQVEAAIDALRDREEHHSHGELPAHTVPQAKLNAAVQQRISMGMDPWQAFIAGCADVGGAVVEEGPESLCRRQ
jgi:hypothetical protein